MKQPKKCDFEKELKIKLIFLISKHDFERSHS